MTGSSSGEVGFGADTPDGAVPVGGVGPTDPSESTPEAGFGPAPESTTEDGFGSAPESTPEAGFGSAPGGAATGPGIEADRRSRELDEEVLRSLQANESGAFDRFVDRFGDRVYGFGMRMCGRQEDAEDVFQESLLTVYRRIRDLRHPGALRTWIFRIVANHCRSAHRKVRETTLPDTLDLDALLPTEGPFDLGPVVPSMDDPELGVYRRELGEALETAVSHLPADYRLVWLLRDVEGLDTRETAEALGIQEGNVKMRLHRARLALRRDLAHFAPAGSGPGTAGTLRGEL